MTALAEETASPAVYVINLDRAAGRWHAMQGGLADLPWPVQRIAALDAQTAPDSVLAFRGQRISAPPNGLGRNPYRHRVFSLVEEACFCSHLLALRGFLATARSHAVILEDDAVPRRDLAADLLRILASGADFDIVKLEGIRHAGARLAVQVADTGTAQLVHSFRPCPGSAAYLVSRRGAEKLIERSAGLLIPYDDFLNSPSLTGCRTLHISPWLVWQAGLDSDLRDFRFKPGTGQRRRLRSTTTEVARRVGLRLRLWGAAAVDAIRRPLSIRMMPW